MSRTKLLILIIFMGALGVFFALGWQQYFTLEYFNASKNAMFAYYAENPFKTMAGYFLLYVTVTGLSLPGAALMTLAGGAIFGFWIGVLLVSFASTIGASLAFLCSKTLLKDWVQQRFGERLGPINEGIEKDGAFYLFSVRLIPVFPFFLVNLLMGLTAIKLRTFFWVSQLGMLAGTLVYVNAGKQLATIDTIGQVMSPALILSFVLLAIFPLVVKKALGLFSDRRALVRFDKPASFDANVIVIGAGSAGLVSSLIAATVNAKAILIERHKMGGDCLNTGCVPSKALLRSAKINHYFDRAQEFGMRLANKPEVDFQAVMQRVQTIIKAIEPHDSVERFEGLGVQCEYGNARIVSPYEVELTGAEGSSDLSPRRLTAASIIIASGARPFIPPIAGLEAIPYYTSDTIWQLESLPKKLLVMGAGPIGCELAQAFSRLGSDVTLVDMAPRVLPREDEDAAQLLVQSLQRDGVNIMVSYKAVRVEAATEGALYTLYVEREGREEGQELGLEFEHLLIAVGRKANTEDLGLEALGIATNRNGTVQVDEHLRTSIPTIFACGDVAGPYQFTHTASHQAWFATVNALFGVFKKFKVDYSVIPWATFTDPEIARVGLNEGDAQAKNIAHDVTIYNIEDLDRAIAEGEAHGFVKVLTAKKSDKILGVTIVAHHASELLAQYVLAMKHGLGLKKIMATIHVYPTLSEANKFAASEWSKKNKPETLLQWVGRFHHWRRGT